MNTVLDRAAINIAVREHEAAKHNAQIKERYERLRNIEANQFAQFEQEERTTVKASVLAPEKPVERTTEQTPTVTEYTKTEDLAIFSPATLDRTLERTVSISAPTIPVLQPPVQPMPVAVVTPTAEMETVAQYTLSALAKKVLVAFACVVVALLTVISINSYVLTQKRVRVEKLERQRQQLEEKNEEIQKRIQQATNEETIRGFIEQNAMVHIG